MPDQVDRRDFVKAAADTSKTLVIACPATPQGLGGDYDVSLGTVDSTGALYDNLIAYKKIPDPASPEVMREDIGVHPDQPCGLALEGKLATKWELSPDGKKVTFTLREGVKSAWGNPLTAEDVKVFVGPPLQ